MFMLLPLTPRRPLSLPLRWMKCSWRLLAWLLQAYPGAPGVLLAVPGLLLAAPGLLASSWRLLPLVSPVLI